MPKAIVIIGPGRWGSALGKLASKSFPKVSYLSETSKGDEWAAAFGADSPLCILACPFKAIEENLEILKSKKIAGVINAAKGIDRKTLLTFSSLARKYLKVPYATLSGPTFAQEVFEERPSACVLAGKNKVFITAVAKKLSTSQFRIYPSLDPVGVEACGAIKNVLAIACGISDGLGLGLNARAALLTRGLKEMAAIVKVLKGNPASVFGLAGVGDLWLTATGDLSRNRQLGILIAKGENCESGLSKLEGPAEGLYTVEQVQKLAKKHKLDLPICREVYLVCSGKRKPQEALQVLMTRELKSENPLKV